MSVFQAMRGLANVPWFWALRDFKHLVDGNGASIAGSVTATSSATINTKGTWFQVDSSLSEECGMMCVACGDAASSGFETSALLDIATGASGSETVIVSNVGIGGASQQQSHLQFCVPIRIPSGTRISARTQCCVASRPIIVRCGFLKTTYSHLLPTSVDVMGTATATSRGTVMSGSSGTYVQVTASTAQRYRAIVIVPSNCGDTMNTATYRYTLAVGAAGSEVDLGSILFATTTAEAVFIGAAFPNLPIACDVAAGSRLSIKHDIGSNVGSYGVTLIGVP